jgi:hypothetical protein
VGKDKDTGIEAPAYDYETIPSAEIAKEIPADPNADLHMDPEEDTSEMVSPLEAPPTWRVAKSLLKLREQVNAMAPRRSKASDGTIGDARHRTRASDHNPWVAEGGIGIVTAMDITHDPGNGCSAESIAEAIRSGKDSRVKYIIWNRRIANSAPKGGAPAWGWRPYTGRNGHTHHIHISVKSDSASYDSERTWQLGAAIA